MYKVFDFNGQKENLVKNTKEKSLKNCDFKARHSPVQSSEGSLVGKIQQFRRMEKKNLGINKLNVSQNEFSRQKLKFQCHYEEHKRRAEIKRKNFIQKLKYIYNIDIRDFNEDVINEIIKKIRLIENERKQRKQRCMERTITMVTRLLKEQKYKMRRSKVQCLPLKSLKYPELNEGICVETEKLEQKKPESMNVVWKSKIQQNKDSDNFILSSEEEEKEDEAEEEKEERPTTCLEIIKNKQKNISNILTKRTPPCASYEKHLECTPRRVVFKDYKKQKIYLQDLKITNVGIETIHCRYLGILARSKNEGKFPIGVAVRDSVKLRPGLSCSTKIRLCSPDDSSEMECSVVYETRRKNKCFEYSWFFVPVTCIPCRAIVKVTPLRITFPALTWRAATGSENASCLKKSIKIENTGGKACTCRISDESLRPVHDEIYDEEQREGEEEEEREEEENEKEEGESLNVFPAKAESEFSGAETLLDRGEFFGANYFLPLEVEEVAKLFVNEMIENVFATFRFSKKYCIELPPLSVQHVEVRFIPKYKGFHHEMKYIQFEGCHNLEEQSVELMGDIKQIPLKIEPQLIDLKTCMINSGVYAGIFQVFNCNKGPYAIRLKIPPSLKNHAHVHPRTTIIQPFSSCVFSVRIYPRITLSKDASQYFDEESGVLEFPVRIHPANIDSCRLDHIKLYVHALLTSFDLELSPSVINFGTVTTLETVRTKLELTNHSLTTQEYGFLNLPKVRYQKEGTRVEPNMGFGKILPKETMALHLIYSPLADLFEKGWGEKQVEFDIMVTSIAKYGGFKEKLEPEEAFQEPEWRGEDFGFETPELIPEFSAGHSDIHPNEESEDSDLCDEDFSIEGEELMSKIQIQENKIRHFLKREEDEISGNANQMYVQNEVQNKETEQGRDKLTESGECEGNEKYSKIIRTDMNIIKCRANVLGPRCQISETVIQLPATPVNSFSLYRFKLNGMSETANKSCSCGWKSTSKSSGGKTKFKASFEFLFSSPHITLEPGSGFLQDGEVHTDIHASCNSDQKYQNWLMYSFYSLHVGLLLTCEDKLSNLWESLPITVISRLEVESGELGNELIDKKASDSCRAKPNKRESVISRSNTGLKETYQKKNYEVTPKGNKKVEETSSSSRAEIANASKLRARKSDLFIEDQPLQEMVESSFFEAKVRCVIKSSSCECESQMTETHDMVLISPTIKRHFIYLGKTREINFGKVFIGTQSQVILQVQNISFERISPSMTLLNPSGPFFCLGGFCKVEIDPEHIWRQPLTFIPEERKEIDQFFEIYFGPTNVLLKITGDAVEPRCNLLPNFGCCLFEARMSSFEEIKLEIHNLSPVELFLQLETVFVKEGFDLQIEDVKEKTSEAKKPDRREESKSKKSKNTESDKKKYRLWETVPESIMDSLENFTDCLKDSVFTILGVDENKSFMVPPNEISQIKIQFWAPADRGDKKFAAKYNLVLGRRILLKEMIILGRIFK